MSGSSHLRTVVVDNSDGTFWGKYDATDLIAYLRVAGEEGYERFQSLLNSESTQTKKELSNLPGFVGGEHSVTATTSKRDALARMEKLNTDSLPVVDEQQRFVGRVDRAKLTASLILAVTDKLEESIPFLVEIGERLPWYSRNSFLHGF